MVVGAGQVGRARGTGGGGGHHAVQSAVDGVLHLHVGVNRVGQQLQQAVVGLLNCIPATHTHLALPL